MPNPNPNPDPDPDPDPNPNPNPNQVLSQHELRVAYHELIGLCWKIHQGM